FGLGMSFTVAPLTATVMGSVSANFSGMASGVNNALTRISNVFANAIFGALAGLFFTAALQKQLDKLSFAQNEKETIMMQAVNLGNAKVPATIPVNQRPQIEQYFHESFINAYGRIMLISSALCFIGALMSVLFIKNSAIKKKAEATKDIAL
ncbi:MAG TPA: hypothetical protein VN721_05200, partial [Flavipsychrobacter sp.]|nr:hypothetical protein [Flavipsychrobacter sp.]